MTSTPYQATFSASAQRDLHRLPEKIATAAVEFIYGSLVENPRRVGRELHLDLAEHCAARRGDYRIIYRIDDEAHAVVIVTIDTALTRIGRDRVGPLPDRDAAHG